VQFRSPVQSGAHRSVILRGFVGAVIGASAVAVVALLVPMVTRWVEGDARPAAPNAIVDIPDDTGPALAPGVTGSDHKKRAHAKAKAKAHPKAVLVGGSVVILSGTDTAPSSSAPTPTTEPATVPATRPARSPAKGKAPKTAPKVVTNESNPVAPAVTTPVAANAAPSTGLVRLSVQSVGIAPNAAGDPELQAKLAIQGAQPTDALPDTVTLHLRPQVPAAAQSNNSALALNANVDMVDAPRTTAGDPALRMRVRMTIAPAQAGTPTAVPVVQDPGPADGKSNVIGLTVALASFVRAPEGGTPGDGDPTTPPDNPGTGDPGTGDPGPGDQGPGDPPQQPAPNDPPTTDPPTGGDPSTPPQPAPGGDPTTPNPPTGGDPTTPQQPAPGGDPTTPDPPAAGDPTVIPPTEILIPVGPVRPNEGTTTVPVDPGTTGNAPTTDQVPVVVIVEELPPDEPPVDPADGSTPVVQDPAPEVVAPPADTIDPGTTPAPDAGAGAGESTAVVVSADASPSATNDS
jgi:hypothetical protein